MYIYNIMFVCAARCHSSSSAFYWHSNMLVALHSVSTLPFLRLTKRQTPARAV